MRRPEKYFQESLDYSLLTGDSLLVAIVVLACATFITQRLLKRTSIQKKELTDMVEEAIESISEAADIAACRSEENCYLLQLVIYSVTGRME